MMVIQVVNKCTRARGVLGCQIDPLIPITPGADFRGNHPQKPTPESTIYRCKVRFSRFLEVMKKEVILMKIIK